MHRLGDRAAITSLVDRIRTRIPGVTFRTAFIVGFPGETEQAFEELRGYMEDAEFDRTLRKSFVDLVEKEVRTARGRSGFVQMFIARHR